jgi:hypothetical protein
VLDGGIPVDVDVEEDVAIEEDVPVEEDIEVVKEEEAELVDCCCGGVDTVLSLCVAESPPPTPPPMAPPNTRSTTANTIQNVRVASPQMRRDGVEGNSYGGASFFSGW